MVYTEKKLKDLLKDLRASNISSDEAYDIADGILFEEEGLKEYIESKGIRDVLGWLANRV